MKPKWFQHSPHPLNRDSLVGELLLVIGHCRLVSYERSNALMNFQLLDPLAVGGDGLEKATNDYSSIFICILAKWVVV